MSVRVTLYLMLLSVPLLREGVICLIFAAPILLGVAAGIGALFDSDRKRNRKSLHWVTIVIAITAVEGMTPQLSFQRANTVTISRTLEASPQQVALALGRTPAFTEERPWLARMFPIPVATWGQSLELGDRHTVAYRYYKHVFFSPYEGETVYEVNRLGPGVIGWRVVSDTSYLSTYLRYIETEVRWRESDNGGTDLTWRVSYERKLDPAWYFGPLERYYVGLGSDYMVEHINFQ